MKILKNIKQSKTVSMKKIVAILIVIFWTMNYGHGQTKPMFSQYMFNMLNMNPAYAGIRNTTSITALGRTQWVGIDGAPKTGSVSVDTRLNDKNWGLGMQLYDDELGIEKSTGVQGYVSLHLPLSYEEGGTTLSMGVGFGLLNYRGLFTQAQQHLINPGDPAFSNDVKGLEPNAGAGILLHKERWYVGASLPSLLQSQILSNGQLNVSSLLQRNELFLTGGYVFGEEDAQVRWKPSVLLKMASGAPVETDINLNVWFDNTFSAGASYRTGDSFIGMIELQASPNFRIGFAYDYTVSQLNPFARGTYELMLRYEIGSGSRGVAAPIRYY